MNSLITGAAGFIGSNLARKLSEKGDNILGIDDVSSGALRNLNGIKNFRLFISDSGGVQDVSFKPDILFHLGIPSSSAMYNRNVSKKAVNSFTSVLKYCERLKIPMVLASTSSMYTMTCRWDINDYKTIEAREDMEITTHDFYTDTRRQIELKLLASDLDCVILRFFSVYGPSEESKGLYANVVYQAIEANLSGSYFKIYGEGNQTRDFIYVTDVVEALVKSREYVFKNEGQNIFNVGTHKQTSFKKVIGLIENITKQRSFINYGRIPQFYIYRTKTDPSKAEKVLGFKPRISIAQGINKVVNARRKERNEKAERYKSKQEKKDNKSIVVD